MKIKTKLKKKFDNARAGASKEVFDDIIEILEKDLQGVTNQILDPPKDVLNWENQVAMLVGEARSYRNIISLLTVTEK